MLDHIPGAHRTTALMPAAANDAVEVALSDCAVDDRIVRALSLAVHDVVARLVAIREAERGAASFEVLADLLECNQGRAHLLIV